ncbi:hypothetical protein [Aneurinibacillus aneurinilyticus]|uniref:Uncharacterized protein n=1 Tax=Aneurinibacillus aneurinilyticus ATCC 12856 TaxID=649747 RepID=U1YE11_ANEAE|nr:hypothetical protein [Aneurinibacillus aneurinilyticus]ERI09036.1 hypothetical protein HMPREF0083_02814 [Aneurinibacillus aneurinilyticus ATCC 12856]MED0707554.1 hypothetical protein [Aneurinibacillus aneurinilyticus]MED0723922.1 hypothetical protein [Aneurinibacillus aneurinilyticus]MED0731744.1 hypothetical protein [Aneurinibacillus aneurinilyticus]MED0739406.1 hypothetical protein [Aneurinibacillus aneurinilyticus]
MNTNLEMRVFMYYREGMLQSIYPQETDKHGQEQQSHLHRNRNKKTLFIRENQERLKVRMENDTKASQALGRTASKTGIRFCINIEKREWDTS